MDLDVLERPNLHRSSQIPIQKYEPNGHLDTQCGIWCMLMISTAGLTKMKSFYLSLKPQTSNILFWTVWCLLVHSTNMTHTKRKGYFRAPPIHIDIHREGFSKRIPNNVFRPAFSFNPSNVLFHYIPEGYFSPTIQTVGLACQTPKLQPPLLLVGTCREAMSQKS